ncbi:MAG: hypothetical protein K5780_01145 [Alphaproteobacteria bacterium]|nr:hypothetical protein [Alphaproteobacteria bacterium]
MTKWHKKSFQNVATVIELFVLPWFQKCGNTEGYREELLKKSKSLYRSIQEFIAAIDEFDAHDDVVVENIKRLELPFE